MVMCGPKERGGGGKDLVVGEVEDRTVEVETLTERYWVIGKVSGVMQDTVEGESKLSVSLALPNNLLKLHIGAG